MAAPGPGNNFGLDDGRDFAVLKKSTGRKITVIPQKMPVERGLIRNYLLKKSGPIEPQFCL